MYLNLGKEETFHVYRRERKRTNSFTLRLTAMIDMFTILLVFLLKSYSMEGEIISVSKDLRLPQSTAKTPPKATPILVITNEWIILDGNPVERVRTAMAGHDLSIPNLRNRLQRLRDFSEQLGQLDQTIGFHGNITIQGDKEITFKLLKKVMFTCGKVGYNNMLLAVHQQGER